MQPPLAAQPRLPKDEAPAGNCRASQTCDVQYETLTGSRREAGRVQESMDTFHLVYNRLYDLRLHVAHRASYVVPKLFKY